MEVTFWQNFLGLLPLYSCFTKSTYKRTLKYHAEKNLRLCIQSHEDYFLCLQHVSACQKMEGEKANGLKGMKVGCNKMHHVVILEIHFENKNQNSRGVKYSMKSSTKDTKSRNQLSHRVSAQCLLIPSFLLNIWGGGIYMPLRGFEAKLPRYQSVILSNLFILNIYSHLSSLQNTRQLTIKINHLQKTHSKQYK